MRIKIKDTWYDCRMAQPIMVELSEKDKQNIANMAPDATKYAIFDDRDNTTDEQKRAWMNSGY